MKNNELNNSDFLINDLIEEISSAMEKSNINPAIIYAFKKTGLLVSEDNIDLITDEDMKEWTDAVDEYNDKYIDNSLNDLIIN